GCIDGDAAGHDMLRQVCKTVPGERCGSVRMHGMSSRADRVVRVLTRLNARVRRPPSGGRTVRTRRVPGDLAMEGFELLALEPDEEELYQEAQAPGAKPAWSPAA